MCIVTFRGGFIDQMHDSFTTRYQLTACEIHGDQGSLIAINNMARAPASNVTLCNQDSDPSPLANPPQQVKRKKCRVE